MKHRVTVSVPVEKKGLFGRKKIAYEERIIIVDGKTYRQMKQAKEDAEFEEFLDFMEEMDLIEEIMNE